MNNPSNHESNHEEIRKLKKIQLLINSRLQYRGLRLLIAYQCIKCGVIFDSPEDWVLHMHRIHKELDIDL
jgi:hypothetical protein